MLIQILLLAVIIGALGLFVHNWHSVHVRALKRLAFLAFILLTMVAIIWPASTNWIAHKLGVGRGADLVLYSLFGAFVFVSVNTYFRFKTQENRFTDLARAIAVRDALQLNAERFGK